MLVLSRKKNESIIINDNIEIVVVQIQGSTVRLAIAAPKEVPIHRQEIRAQLQQNRSLEAVTAEPRQDLDTE